MIKIDMPKTLWRAVQTGSPRMFVEHVTGERACIMVPSSGPAPVLAGVKTSHATTEPSPSLNLIKNLLKAANSQTHASNFGSSARETWRKRLGNG